MIQIVKHYRSDEALRRSFNALAGETFGLNFENWYQNGFWGDAYDPYSVVADGRIVANVSVNRTDMIIGGQRRRLYQLGTVMTARDCRNRGYIRDIMAEIEKDTADADGIYLFASDSVLDFYPKFGFVRGTEHIYSKAVEQAGPCRMKNIPMDGPADWSRLSRAMEENVFHTAGEMPDCRELLFFYVSQFMQDCVFYQEGLDAWVIAEQNNGTLLIHNVFSSKPIGLDDVVSAFGGGIHRVTLGFTPEDTSGFECRELQGDDCTFFVKGGAFRDFAERKLRIPSLAHA